MCLFGEKTQVDFLLGATIQKVLEPVASSRSDAYRKLVFVLFIKSDLKRFLELSLLEETWCNEKAIISLFTVVSKNGRNAAKYKC